MIGMACLRALPPAEASRDTLLSRIAELASEAGGLANSAQFRRSLRAKSRRDFRIGAVLTVDGWVLSITEARVYALTALLKAETDSVSGEGPPPMAAAS